MIYPCKGCKDRHTGCHAECERYKAACAERKKIREERYKEHELIELSVKRAERIKKQQGRKGK